MTDYDIKNVGTAVVDKKYIKCEFSINYDKFAEIFDAQISELTSPEVALLQVAVRSKKETKIDGKLKGDFDNFFSKVQSAPVSDAGAKKTSGSASGSGVKTGFDTSEKGDAAKAEQYKKQDATSKEVKIIDKDSSSAGIQTKDSKTGKVEGEIILDSEMQSKGEFVPLELIEKVEAMYEFNETKPKEEGRKTEGVFKITNPSEKNHLWDIDVTFKKPEGVEIEDHIFINRLEPKGTQETPYKVKELAESAITVKEFISTLNNDTETYALAQDKDNVVLFKITLTNLKDYALSNLKLEKAIQSGYLDATVKTSSVGEAKVEGENVVWTIEKLEAKAEATISINMTIKMEKKEGDDKKDNKNRSGKIKVEYSGEKSFTGLDIEKFDAYTENFVGMEISQQDQDPDQYDCSVIFENRSDFQVKLVNLDITHVEENKKYVDIDPADIDILPGKAKWQSIPFVVKTKDGAEPSFHKLVEFFVTKQDQVKSQGLITIEDIELAIALLMGKISYSVTQIESYREIPFNSLMQVKNNGSADFNELIMQETIQTGYIPPKAEEVMLYIIRPDEKTNISSDEELQKVEWENLGEEIQIDKSLVEITPNDQEPTAEHTLKINLKDLRSNPIGMFVPGTVLRAKYPLKAMKVAKDTEYISNVKYTANTFPAGSPIEVSPEVIKIPVLHIRKKTIKGKELHALPDAGKYEIIMFLENTGTNPLENITIKDVVPSNFEYADFSLEPTKYDNLEGKDLLVWQIEKVAPNEKVEIKYHINGRGDYKASDAQFSV